jgi:hypothetical protein
LERGETRERENKNRRKNLERGERRETVGERRNERERK